MDNIITSKDNTLIKNIRKLKEKKYRELEKKYIVEGIKLVTEAINVNEEIETIIVSTKANRLKLYTDKFHKLISKYKIYFVSEAVFKTISDVEAPQGVLAVVRQKEAALIDYTEEQIVLLDGINDPGNLGTILRTLDACGYKQLLITNNTIEPLNPKVIRASMGAIFRINVITINDNIQEINNLKEKGFSLVTTSLQESENLYTTSLEKTVIVMGNEANGVSKEIENLADKRIKIPMLGKTESLNVAIATTVILYENLRRKL